MDYRMLHAKTVAELRQIARAEDEDLADFEPRGDARIFNNAEMVLPVQLDQRVNIIRAAVGDDLPLAVDFFLNRP